MWSCGAAGCAPPPAKEWADRAAEHTQERNAVWRRIPSARLDPLLPSSPSSVPAGGRARRRAAAMEIFGGGGGTRVGQERQGPRRHSHRLQEQLCPCIVPNDVRLASGPLRVLPLEPVQV